ncbi:HGGxSTG domain-containing protein [Microvirga massiliensis]|uniref:HGGxSTG domain-containing protein n=1 Tax=Microvirga massiliensis TaxID=1033741 RepID=UPI003CC7FEE9
MLSFLLKAREASRSEAAHLHIAAQRRRGSVAAGQPRGVRVEPGKRRCRVHGGLSTGPRSSEGKARIAEAQRRRQAARR